MIKFRTLDGELVQFDNDLKLKILDVDKEPHDFFKYFPDFDEEVRWRIYIAVLVCVGDKPIWGAASRNDELDELIETKDGDDLTNAEKWILNNHLEDKTLKEMKNLRFFGDVVIITNIIELIDEIPEDDLLHIVDVRRMYVKDCERYGYYVSTYVPSPEA